MIPIYPDKTASNRNLDDLLVENEETGEYRVHRSVFTDEALFELEMKHIFEGNWIYLAHESQVPNNNDYYTTYIGRQPIVIARNRQGELNAFINPARTAAPPCAATRAATLPISPSMAGRSTTAASC